MPKKKKTETKPVEKQGPKEIKSAKIKTTNEGVLLTLDDREFLLNRNDMARMINQHSPGTEPLRIEDLIPEDSFKDLNTVENVAKLTVFMSRQGLPAPEVAKRIGISGERLVRWLNDGQAKVARRNIMTAEKEKFLKAVEKLDPKAPRKKMRGFDPIKVGKLFVEGGSNLDFVVKKLKTTRPEFMQWYQLNMKEVTRYINRVASDNVINELRDLMDKEDDDRASFVYHT